jgi:formate C-acetyltransferase
MMFYNDTDIINAYKAMGLPDKDARNYSHFGCNWPSPGTNAAWMCNPPRSPRLDARMSKEERELLNVPYDKLRSSAPHGFVEDFMNIFRRLSDVGAESIEDFYSEFWKSVGDFLDFKLEHLSRELNARKRCPSTILTYADCFLSAPMKKGISFAAGASDYYYELQSVQGLGTLIDCFVTVDELVFRQKKTSLAELLAAVDANFEGYERLHALCLSVDKYGSDTPLSNAHARRLTETYARLVQEKSRPYLKREGLFLETCLQSDTWHLKWGKIFGATPDGRLAGKPFSHNTRPTAGACKNGLTGMLNSILSIPFENFMSGSLNIDLQKKDFEGEKGLEIFSALFGSYFNRGGLHAQVSVNNAEELIDAQANPDAHRDLRVRVTGYSGVFVDICKELQNDIIERTIKEK